MKKSVVIFDLDGTLLDTIGDLAAACNRILSQHGYPLHTEAEYRLLVGGGISKLIEAALPPAQREASRIAALRESFIADYGARIAERTRPYPGIEALLAALVDRGITLAVLSNKYHAGTLRLVHRFFATIPFAAVLGQREGVPVKPDPAAVHEILSATACERGQALFVGDSAVDMLTARNAGIESVGVLWGFRSQEELARAGADHLVARPMQIEALVGAV